MEWWTVLTIQTDYSTPTAALGRLAHSHCEALSLAGYSWLLADKVWQNPNGAPQLAAAKIGFRNLFKNRIEVGKKFLETGEK